MHVVWKLLWDRASYHHDEVRHEVQVQTQGALAPNQQDLDLRVGPETARG